MSCTSAVTHSFQQCL